MFQSNQSIIQINQYPMQNFQLFNTDLLRNRSFSDFSISEIYKMLMRGYWTVLNVQISVSFHNYRENDRLV